MANFEARPIIINSDTLSEYQFLSGFITFDDSDNNSVGTATLEAATDKEKANLLYVEDTKNQIVGAIKPLTPFTFKLNQPTEYTVQFEKSDKTKKPKVTTSSSQGHAQPVDPKLYIGRPFIMEDDKLNDSSSKIYAFLIDTYLDDTLSFDGTNTITITSGRSTVEKTQIFLFDINTRYTNIQVNLNAAYDPKSIMDYSTAPIIKYVAYFPPVTPPNTI